MLTLVQASVGRMAALIDNLLDFARGRLGGGLALSKSAEPLKPALSQVIDELRTGHPERMIAADIDLAEAVNCDHARMAQLLSNLVGNALAHGAPGSVVRVRARTEDANFVLSVINNGDPIPAGTLERLFQPFERGAGRPGQEGLGLGLFISSEIARAHGGELHAASSAEETAFTLRMPLDWSGVATA